MSEIIANIVVEPINLTITQTDPGITITPEAINLNIFTGGYACAQGNTNEVQYNAGGYLAGSIGLQYYSANSTTVANALVVNGNANVGNLGTSGLITATGNITGGNLITSGTLNVTGNANVGNINSNAGIFTGNVSAGNVNGGNLISANYLQGTLITAAQPNITSLGNLTSLTVTGNITAGNANLGNAASANYFLGNGALLTGIDTSLISNGNSNVKVFANANIAITSAGNANIAIVTGTGVNVAGTLNVSGNIAFTGTNVSLGNIGDVEIYGGNNGQFLQTDGAGNLSFVSGGGSGNGVVGGSNTQIQYNDGGNFGGTSGFTFNKSTNAMATPGNITANGNISANYYLGNGSQLTGIVLSSLSNGNSNINILANANITISSAGNANIVQVTGTGINISGTANITGNVSAGNISATNLTGTLTTAAQPNITSVGSLTSLTVTGTTSLYETLENISLGTIATGNLNYNLLDGAIQYYTSNANANVSINFRGNGTITANTLIANGQSITAVIILKNGSTAYGVSNVSIDNSAQTIQYVNGNFPVNTSNALQSYIFTIIKTNTTPAYTVLGSLTRYS